MNDKTTPTNPEKTPSPSPEEELVAFLDGELDAANRRRVEEMLAKNPALREVLKQHESIFEALAGAETTDGIDSHETLARVHNQLRRSRRTLTATILAAAAALVLAALIGARLFTTGLEDSDPTRPLATGEPPVENPVETTGSQPEVIADLEVLEILQEEGGEISLEFVNLLLEEDGGTGVLDSGLFNEWLEEEITGENF